jgi:hypothetical protein
MAEVAVRIDPGQDGGYGRGTWAEAEGRWIDFPNTTWDGPVRYLGKFRDVSNLTFSVNIRRGRQDETEPYGAGSATVAVRNLDGFFDPDGPFPLRVRQPIQIRSSANTYGQGTWAEATGTWQDVEPNIVWLGPSLFIGFIEDTDLRYEPSGDAQLDIRCVDGLSILSNQVIAPTAVPLEVSGDRVRRVLNAEGVDFPGPVSVEDGFSLLAPGTADGNATEYLRRAELSEQGRLFVDRTGVLRFFDRRQTFGTPYVFADDGTGTAYSFVDRFSGARSLFNRIVARREDGPTFAFNDQRSQDEFSTRTLDLGTLLAASDTLVTGVIEFLTFIFRRPLTRVFAATVPVDRLSPEDEYELVELDLFTPADIKFTPPGSSSLVTQALIQGIEHNITVGGAWTTQFYFERREVGEFMTLDDVTLGRLNLNRLGF